MSLVFPIFGPRRKLFLCAGAFAFDQKYPGCTNMDSLTQIVLGASVGEATLGKQVGNRAPLWGAIVATLPDLDVLASWFQGELAYLGTHRGASHSLAFSLLMAPILGWLIHRFYREKWGSRRGWSWLSFWGIFTHILLDCFTTWGTQVFYPFSEYRVAFNSIFVIDPLYTLPFMLFVLVVLFLKRENRLRRVVNGLGLFFSTFYLVLTVINKQVVDAVFANELHRQGRSVRTFSTYPTPFNNLLWYVVAEEPEGYDLGYYSLMGRQQPLDFRFIPHQHRFISPYRDSYVVKRLRWFSKDQYVITGRPDSLVWNDLRFGLSNGWAGDSVPPEFGFSFELLVDSTGKQLTGIHQLPFDAGRFTKEGIAALWKKMWGEEAAEVETAEK